MQKQIQLTPEPDSTSGENKNKKINYPMQNHYSSFRKDK
jgi:hypothetical protein